MNVQDVKPVLVAPDGLLAQDYAFQAQHRKVVTMNLSASHVTALASKASESGDLVNEVDGRAVREINYSVRGDGGSSSSGNVEHTHILARWQVNPQVHVQSVHHYTLCDGSGHPDNYVTDLFRFEGFQ